MDYVLLMSWRESLTRDERDEALVRRSTWSYPQGLDVKAEYWAASTDHAVVVIAAADSYAPIMEVAVTWSDKFRIEVHPAVSAEEGLRIGPEVLGRARA